MHLAINDSDLAEAGRLVASAVRDAGGRALLVGGSIRDAWLGLPIHDLDFEIYGLDPERLQSVLAEHFELDLVGRSFGVLKIRHLAIDVALPRRESKRGLGHRGFEVHSDPNLPFPEAAARRDFTVNAMGYDPLDETLLDPWNGRHDLEAGVLRHVSSAFVEDPLRVLRGMQLAARFGFVGAQETLALCRSIEPEGLARERIFDEWKKLILAGRQISRGLSFLRASGWLEHFPELAALVHCPQDPEWHPEGDVWIHTGHVLDAFADQRLGETTEDLIVGLACLCHDLGKPATTHFVEGRWRSPNHEAVGDPPTRAFLGRMTDQRDLIEAVVPLVREHLKPIQLYAAGSGPAAIRRLARRVGRIDRLVRVCRADHAGRPPLPGDFPAGDWLLDQAAGLRLEAEAPKPIVQGRHLIELGVQPGRHFGPILAACFEAQLDGAFDDLDQGIRHAARILSEADAAEIEAVTRADEC